MLPGYDPACAARAKTVAKKFPTHPKYPERICWGCDKYCPADSLSCGNGTDRTQHPAELFGDDWYEWGLAAWEPASAGPAPTSE